MFTTSNGLYVNERGWASKKDVQPLFWTDNELLCKLDLYSIYRIT